MKEIWKDISGFEGRYQVSNLGRVKSLRRYNHQADPNPEIMKSLSSSGRYPKVNLYNGGGFFHQYLISHLVAANFLPGIRLDGLRIIYKDGDPKNCKLTNLIVSDGIKEMWSTIPNYLESYEVSTLGRVRVWSNLSNSFSIMRQSENKDGYLCVSLLDDKRRRRKCYVHKLVAETFLDNPDDKQAVCHKDIQQKWDNCVSNLTWATRKEVSKNVIDSDGRSPQSVHVLCIETGDEFPSKRSAETTLGLPKNSVGRSIASGKPINGYTFKETRRIKRRRSRRLF